MKNLIFAFLLFCLPAQAVTRYVSKTGSDANACSATDSSGTNKLTISGTTGGLSCMSPGDILLIHAGTYTERPIVPISLSGTSWATATTIGGVVGETVIVNGNFNPILAPASGTGMRFVIFQNFIVDGSLQSPGVDGTTLTGTDLADHIRYLNMEIRNAPGGYLVTTSVRSSFIEFIGGSYHGSHDTAVSAAGTGYGFYCGGSNGLWDGVEVYDTENLGLIVYVYPPDHPTSFAEFNIVKNSVFHDVHRGTVAGHNHTATGLLVGGNARNNTVYNNIIYGTGATGSIEQGLQIDGGTDNAFYNNTIYKCFGAGIYFGSSATSTRPVIRNNILDQDVIPIQIVASPATPTYSNNMANVSGTGVSIVGSPVFVNAAINDFHLQASSPARDAGITVAAVPTDKDGFARPQGSAYDIGVYEYISAVPPPVSTISLTYPNGNENIKVGTAINITWTSNDTHTVSLELSRDDGASYPELIVTDLAQTADATNSYSWTPTAPRILTAKIRVTNLFDLVSDESNAQFHIRGHYVK